MSKVSKTGSESRYKGEAQKHLEPSPPDKPSTENEALSECPHSSDKSLN